MYEAKHQNIYHYSHLSSFQEKLRPIDWRDVRGLPAPYCLISSTIPVDFKTTLSTAAVAVDRIVSQCPLPQHVMYKSLSFADTDPAVALGALFNQIVDVDADAAAEGDDDESVRDCLSPLSILSIHLPVQLTRPAQCHRHNRSVWPPNVLSVCRMGHTERRCKCGASGVHITLIKVSTPQKLV